MMLTPYITQVITPNQKTRKIALALADEFGQVVHLEAVPSRMCIRLIYLLTRRHRKDVPVWSAMLEDRLQREFSCLFDGDQAAGRSMLPTAGKDRSHVAAGDRLNRAKALA